VAAAVEVKNRMIMSRLASKLRNLCDAIQAIYTSIQVHFYSYESDKYISWAKRILLNQVVYTVPTML
jgi:hypothetical protein